MGKDSFSNLWRNMYYKDIQLYYKILFCVAYWIKNPLRRTSEHNDRYNYLNFSFFHKKKSMLY